MHLDAERCYRAVASRDSRFDGMFFTGVRTTGIYCRPSCPAITPRRRNVAFYATSAAAHADGLRACKRCLPDATPGSPEWDVRADAVGRAMRLIRDGVVERDGVIGLAARLGYSQRHVTRLLHAELGAGPLAIARAARAQAARVLVDTTDLGLADIAFAAGFSSVRQFNDTMREVYACTPSALRAGARTRDPAVGAGGTGRVRLRLAVRQPFDARQVLGFLAARAVPGLEQSDDVTYCRTLRLPHGVGRVVLHIQHDHVEADLRLAELRDLGAAVAACRALLDLDADPRAVDDLLGADPVLAPLVAARPGTRVPGHVDGFELAARAVLGQQVTVRGATTLLARLVRAHGQRLDDGPDWLFPTPETLAEADPTGFSVPGSRGAALVALARAVASRDLELDRGADREDTAAALVALPGIGPWTAGYVAMRALGDPDRFLPGDVVLRQALSSLGLPATGSACAQRAAGWRPWRSYAVMHLWRHAAATSTGQETDT
ncbi:MAG: helix-turn-helix domain-containing protein [Actinomycetota bacterium]|nr:helix-turn-helix domain-containing protein [Actinomycetota bacterium]